jgi:octaheme c-type cytochrome (tetrathionate reductase family)
MRLSPLLRIAWPLSLASLLLLGGCDDDNGGTGPTTDVGVDVGGDSGTNDIGGVDGATEDTGADTTPTPDVDEDTGVTPDVTEDTTPDVTEDTTPDVFEDTTPDVIEDTTPDVTEDTTPDVVEDTTPDIDEDIAVVCDPPCTETQSCVDGTCVDNPPVCDPACTDQQICVNGTCLAKSFHTDLAQLAGPFADGPAVTAQCITCHPGAASDFIETSHWLWRGPTPNMVGHETGAEVGKANTINNFCIAIDSNEPRCTQCHAGYGWKDATFDFAAKGKIDCLSCHDGSGIYKKDPKTAGNVAEGVDLVVAAKSVGGEPTRKACGFCHFAAGGGDNVKKGDMGSWATNPAPEADVHMGNGMTCADCHKADNHKMAGSGLHNPVEENPLACETCHPGPDIHANGMLNTHAQHIACQTCHIPAFSRQQATKMEWYWSEAGDADRVPVNDAYGKPDYDPMKGEFVWGKNVEPTLAWSNGTFKRMLVDDHYDAVPVDLGSPLGSIDDPDAKIAPFKVMIGNQPADPVNQKLIVPHLFGKGPGPNPYWGSYDWALALAEGAAAAGQEYSGTFEFVATTMHLEIHHEVAPKAQARQCNDCHNGGIDFMALGYTGDPMVVGGEHATK